MAGLFVSQYYTAAQWKYSEEALPGTGYVDLVVKS